MFLIFFKDYPDIKIFYWLFKFSLINIQSLQYQNQEGFSPFTWLSKGKKRFIWEVDLLFDKKDKERRTKGQVLLKGKIMDRFGTSRTYKFTNSALNPFLLARIEKVKCTAHSEWTILSLIFKRKP